MFIPLRDIILVAQGLTFIATLLSCSTSWILAASPRLLLLHLFASFAHCVRNQQQTEVGVLRASLLGLRLCLYSLSHSLYTLLASRLTLFCQRESGRSCSSVPPGEQMLYYLYATAFNVSRCASEVAYLPLLISVNVWDVNAAVSAAAAAAAMKTMLAYLIILACILLSCTPFVLLRLNACHVLCMLCPFESLP